MPPIGLLIGGVDFSDLVITLKAAEGTAPAVVISIGKFLQTVIDFTIIAFAIFMLVKVITKVKAKDVPVAAPTAQEVLLTEIRDLLRDQKQ